MLNSFIQKINTIGISQHDDEILKNKKRFVIYEAILMSLGGVMWGFISLSIGKTQQSFIPFGYVILSIFNIIIFSRFKWFKFTQSFQTGISLVLPFLFQWHLGGFYLSGGVMIWALLSLAASLSYSKTSTSILWLIVYALLVVFSGIFDSTFAIWFPSDVSHDLSVTLITLNITVVSILIFLLVIFYVLENNKSYFKVRDAQQMLIQSEKLSALGQLSAGIAHEINTPLGAIKAIAEESKLSIKNSYLSCLSLHKSLSKSNLEELEKFVFNHQVQQVFLTTREERSLRNNLVKILEEQGIENTFFISQQLVEIDVYEFPLFMRNIPKDQIPFVIEIIHSIFIQQKNSHTSYTSVEKASRIVKALKMYLHKTSENELEQYNLKESIDTVLTIYQNQLKHGITISISIPESINLMGHVDEISQVWTNLIVNACQAMEFNGKLTISAKENKDTVKVEINDTGCGIPEELREKIFQPFFSTKKIGEGSGLGLDIVKKIIEKHQGKIYFSSVEKSGTTFYIELPKNINDI